MSFTLGNDQFRRILQLIFDIEKIERKNEEKLAFLESQIRKCREYHEFVPRSQANLPSIDFSLFHFLNFFNRFMLRSLHPVLLNPRLVLDGLCTQFSSIILQCVRKMNKGHF